MLSNFEIYRSAAIMLKRHGKYAASEASARADLLFERGDVEGWEVGMRIMDAIRQLEGEASKDEIH